MAAEAVEDAGIEPMMTRVHRGPTALEGEPGLEGPVQGRRS